MDGERADDLPFDLTSAVFDQQDERTPVSTEEREDLPFENLGRTATSLAEHLEEQLRLASDDPRMVAIGEAIIGNLDEDGYLRAEVDEIAKGMGVTAEEVESTLRIVQVFDPTGVAARSVQECLLLQLTADAEPDPVRGDRGEAFRGPRAPSLRGHRADTQALSRSDHGVGGCS